MSHALPIAPEHLSRLSYDDYIVLPLLFLAAMYYMGKGALWDKPDTYHSKWFECPQLHGAHEGVKTVPQRTRNIAEKLKETNSKFVIFWGSQSGTAEGFAHRLPREFRQRLRTETLVADLSDYDPNTISLNPHTKVAVFMSTYGEGDPADNSWDLVNWLKSSSSNSDSALKNLRYAAFGLENSKYRFYNKVINDVVTSLNALQATSLSPVCKGDEAARSTEEDFVEWKDHLFAPLVSKLDLTQYEPEYNATICVVEDNSVLHPDLCLGEPVSKHKSNKRSAHSSSIAVLPVKEHRQLIANSSSGRKCVHVEVDLSSHPQIKYKTGDHIAVWPVNPSDEVSDLLRLLGLESRKDNLINITSIDQEENGNSLKVPQHTTYQALFQHYLEICGPLPRETVLSLAQFATTDRVKGLLKTLGKEKHAYAEFLKKNHITFVRLLQYTLSIDSKARWTNLPISFVIESIPPMTSRKYSISSSSTTSPRRICITAAVKPTPLAMNPEITVPGLTSTYLSTLEIDNSSGTSSPTLFAQIISSAFKLPVLSTTPIIMVAAGTGIAPFRGFVQDRARLASTGRPVGHMMLFFGCQNPNEDYLYRDELAELMAGPLKNKLEIITAFSRMAGSEKRYVQDRVREKAREVGGLLLAQDGAFYICGAANMAKEVENVVVEAIVEQKSWKETEVEAWRQDRKKAKRWHEDVWG
jgi:NADPH-ferrihemoprotein reductase